MQSNAVHAAAPFFYWWLMSLQDEQLSPALQQELSQLEHFCCGSFFGQRVEPLRPVSFKCYREELGWVLLPVLLARGRFTACASASKQQAATFVAKHVSLLSSAVWLVAMLQWCTAQEVVTVVKTSHVQSSVQHFQQAYNAALFMCCTPVQCTSQLITHTCRRLLGFAHNVRGVPLDQLRLSTLVPSAGREGVSLLLDYQHWRQQKGVAARSHMQPIKAVTVAARYLYHDLSSVGAALHS
jgi:hypothetical protein